ncbi:MAG: PLP-dependent aminotransferase family protein [Candidatus Enterenecus sp.]
MELTVTLPVFQEGQSLYEQLYRHLAGEIAAGRLPAGGRLPSKRKLCALLGVSMSTVDAAYSLLAAEGYVTVRPRSGYTVADLLPLSPPPAADSPRPQPPQPRWRYDCSTSAVDTSVFPFSSWARITKEAVYENPDLLQRGHPQGDLPLRTALAGLLGQYRGVRCSPEQIIIGAGADWLLSMVLQLLPEHQAVALEDPGYPAAYAAAAHLGRRAVPIPVDSEGMDPEALEDSGASLAYVTPSHQFPLGVTMPAGRRSRLLHWAYAAPGRYLIEDDYDSEFRYSSRPIPALQGLDREGRVVYLGTFSRSIAPAIRVAYLILPPALLERYRAEFSHSACTVSRFEQEALRRFLVQGLYGRHLRRAGNLYRRKCALFTQALSAIDGVTLSGQQAGLHFLLTLPRLSEEELVERAAERSVRVHPLSRYCHSVPPLPSTVVVGFAGLREEELAGAAAALAEACRPPDR